MESGFSDDFSKTFLYRACLRGVDQIGAKKTENQVFCGEFFFQCFNGGGDNRNSFTAMVFYFFFNCFGCQSHKLPIIHPRSVVTGLDVLAFRSSLFKNTASSNLRRAEGGG